jgi:hypothetical protein
MLNLAEVHAHPRILSLCAFAHLRYV